METSTDAELLQRVAAGDLGALGELYDRYQDPVRRFLARATSDAEDVDDLLHATFLTAGEIAARYDGRASCRPWLIGIAARHLRRRGRAFHRVLDFLATLGRKSHDAIDPRTALDARRDVGRALARLSEPKRITLLMAEVEGFSCAEIAGSLGVPIGTVWTRLHAARREMRATLEGEER